MDNDIFSGKKVLITGGLGFIGSNLAIKLVELGADVTLVDSLIPTYGGNLWNVEPIKDKVRINISDVRDPYAMKYLISGQHYLFNLAGQTSHIDSMENPETDLAINTQAQLQIVEACRHHNPDVKVVFASTRQVYGRPVQIPVKEDHLLSPVDLNGVHK
ncbi:MAG: NAD-dependent epimerase/dehydratase family protein, partial [Anaerolineaceae bacterium]|nr:NAD-dependent epimerase/dehydratase family protein [Anaerolineaceae bacterium]